jgi:predicted MFS family arabinose efflux permease
MIWMQGAVHADRRQEVQSVAILALGFGLVGIDRFLIATMYPVIARDLHLSYSDIGSITGALAVAWGFSALFIGNLSDRIGRRRVLTVSLVVFSLLIGASGLATGLLSLIAVRVIMGLADGAYTPASIAATLAASPPGRGGLNIGIQQMMLPLCGLGLAPLLVAGVLRYIDWRLVFLIFVIPGLALAFAMWKIIPAPAPVRDLKAASNEPTSTSAIHGRPGRNSTLCDWKTVMAYPNVRVAALAMLCWLTCLITTSAFMPNYLVDHLHLRLEQMGGVMSSIGLGATAGTLLLPWLSDKLGRKPVMALSSVGVFVSLLLLVNTKQNVSLLFGFLFLVHFFNNALITLTVGPLCIEAVPASLMATASGVVIAVGELFGGGLAPVIVGRVAQRFGIEHVLWLPIAMAAVGFLLCLAIRSSRSRAPLVIGGLSS